MNEGPPIYRRVDGILFRSFADRVIMGRSDDGEFNVITGPGRIIWELLEVPRTFGDLLSEVVALFGIDGQRIESDIRSLVGELEARGFLTRSEAGAVA